MSVRIEKKKAIKIFYSYSHKDEKLRDKLETQLMLLKRQGYVTEWHDRKISPGDEWAKAVGSSLRTSDIILLLVSPDFIASEYCYGYEVNQAMELHEAGKARVIPIILRPVNWLETPFGKLQALPPDGKPITSRNWHNQDEAFFAVAEGVRKIVEELILFQSIPSIIKNPEVPKANIVTSIVTDITSSTSPKMKEQQQPTILIIDGDVNIAEFIRLGLHYEGFLVEETTTGAHGLAMAQRLQPTLIILEWTLPGINGLEVCQRLRTNPATCDIPILMLTSKDEVTDRVMGLDMGADDYLVKPFDFEELVARIRAILRRTYR